MARTIFAILAVVLVSVTVVPAQSNYDMMRATSSQQSAEYVATGYLIDAKCALAHMNTLTTTASSHSTACSVGCPTGEYGLVVDGQWLPFTGKSSKKLAKLLAKTTTEKGLTVTVRGTMQDDMFSVASVKEVKHSND